jgi:UPF0755 protein
MEVIRQHLKVIGFGILLILAAVLYASLLAPPASFPIGTIVVVPEGSSITEVSELFEKNEVVKKGVVLKAILRLSGDHIQAGGYLFKEPQNTATIARRLSSGLFGIPPVRITFPEGMTVRDMGEKIEEAFEGLSAAEFLAAGKAHEGYLFPDTYLFSPSSDIETIVALMRENFDKKTKSLSAAISASGRSLQDIVTMASLIEKEARTTEVRKMVSGILWERLRLNMPLQADAVFGYIYGRDTYSPTYEDLKIDSPYNVYKYLGLPPGPINNPGLDAIQAALAPTASEYLYYLVDKEGVIHYGRTYAEHQANERNYLR